MNEIVYSHRPAAGVSVAATNDGPRLIVAFALVNDGTSRNGVMWQERRDAFSRPTARQILNGRLEAARNAPGIPLTVVFEDGMEARRFMAAFRLLFKPTVDESDTVFTTSEHAGNVEWRYRKNAASIVETLYNLANEVVIGARV